MNLAKFKVKCVILGGLEDIKTRLLRNISNSHFQRCYKRIVGVDIGITQLLVDDVPIILSLWDCLCQNRTNFFRTGFYKGSDGAIVCFDSNNDFKLYLDEFKKFIRKKIPILHVYIKENEHDSLDLTQIGNNGIVLQNLDEALNWLAQKMIYPSPENEIAYLEITADLLPEVAIPPDISLEVGHPEILAPILENMGFKVMDEKIVHLLKAKALFTVNLMDANVKVYPLICDICKKECKREKNICIVLDTRGWSTISDLSQKDLLILSKIYALANLPYEELPLGIKNQIKNILYCPKFRKK